MAGPTAISVKQISEAAKQAVSAALDKRKAQFVKPPAPVSAGIYAIPPWWIGFILREIDQEKTTAAALNGLAKEVATGMAASISSARGAEAGAIVHDNHVIIGFIAPPDLRSIVE
jgi:hypothetical protein